MYEFTLFRIPVRVEPFHWLILAFLGAQYFGFDDRNDILKILLFMVAGFFSILVHEFGHALTGRKFGAQGTHVVMHGMGGVAIFPQARFTRTQNFLVTAAGPGIQILLGAIAIVILSQLPEEHRAREFFSVLAQISLIWAIINCVPVFPLDGGQMLGAILGPKREILTHQISIGAAIFFGLLGFFYGFIFLPIFMAFMAYQSWQFIQSRTQR